MYYNTVLRSCQPYLVLALLLNKIPQSRLMPQAVVQSIVLTPVTAPTRHPFHSMNTGQDSRKLRSTRRAMPPMIVAMMFIIIVP